MGERCASWWFVTDGEHIWIASSYEVQSGALVLTEARPCSLEGTAPYKQTLVCNTALEMAYGTRALKPERIGSPADALIARVPIVRVWQARPEVAELLDTLEQEGLI